MKKKISPIGYLCIAVMITICMLPGCATPVGERNQDRDNETPEEPVTITILAGQSTSDAGIEDMIEEVIRREFPYVELEWECVDWGERFDRQIRGRFAAGDIPDIMIGKAQDAVSYASTGNLAPISDRCSSQIREEALETVTVDDTVYGIPYNAWYQGVIYNKQIFRELGLDVPETKEELEAVVEVLNEHEIVPFACHFQESWKIGNMTMQLLMNEVFAEDPLWGDKFREGTVSFSENEKIIECMNSIRLMKENSWSDAMTLTQFDSDSRFTEGEAAMYMTGSWSIQFASEYGGNREFGIFPYPEQEGSAALLRETNITFMKSAVSEHEELVTDILYTLITDAVLAEEILDFTQSFSVIKGIEGSDHIIIQDDIDAYEKAGKVIDVSVGNTQLVWSFQSDLSIQQQAWLQGDMKLEEVLQYADENRINSSYQ